MAPRHRRPELDATHGAWGVSLVRAVRALQDVPQAEGRELTVAVGTTDTPLKHGLGRLPRGFHVADKDAQADVWRSAPSTDQLLTLRASAPVNVILWIY
jgi:hypothetical protein